MPISSWPSAKARSAEDRINAITTGNNWTVPSLNSGWGQGSNDGNCPDLAYRIESGSILHLLGTCHSTSASPNANLFTLPSGFRPSSFRRCPCTEATASAAFANFVGITTGGVVQPFLLTTASGTDYHLNCRIRLL